MSLVELVEMTHLNFSLLTAHQLDDFQWRLRGFDSPYVEFNYDSYLYRMFTVLCKHLEMVTKEIKTSLEQLVRRGRPTNMLHVACVHLADETVPIVHFLLQLQADPNAVDSRGNSPLHVLAQHIEVGTAVIRDKTARLLLDRGAHLDMANNERKTPGDLWLEKNNQQGLN